MRTFFAVGILSVFAVAGIAAAPNTLSLFRYEEKRMNSGAMYTYQVSDFDGNSRMNTYLYLAGDNKVEYYQDFSTVSTNLFCGKFELNKEYFNLDTFKGGNPLGYLAIPNSSNFTESTVDYRKKTQNFNAYYWDASGKEKNFATKLNVPSWPAYELSLSMLDFGLVMRHFIGSKKERFRISCTANGNVWEAEVFLEREDRVNGLACDKWVVNGLGMLAGLQGVKQELWFAKDDPYYRMVLYKNHKFGSPWPKQQLTLVDVQKKTADEWKAMCLKLTEDAKVKFGY